MPRCHSELDGGRYLTSSVVIARDPDTGVRNLSVHRMMVTGNNRFTLLLEELGHTVEEAAPEIDAWQAAQAWLTVCFSSVAAE